MYIATPEQPASYLFITRTSHLNHTRPQNAPHTTHKFRVLLLNARTQPSFDQTDDGFDAETSLSLSLHLYLSSPPLHFFLTLTFGLKTLLSFHYANGLLCACHSNKFKKEHKRLVKVHGNYCGTEHLPFWRSFSWCFTCNDKVDAKSKWINWKSGKGKFDHPSDGQVFWL